MEHVPPTAGTVPAPPAPARTALRCAQCDKPPMGAPGEPCAWCGANHFVEYAHWLNRLGAWLLDGLFVWTAVIVVWIFVLDRFRVHPYVVIGSAFVASWLWHAVWIASGDGATPGHRITGFGVRRGRTLERVSFGRAFTRELIKVLILVIGSGVKLIGDGVMIAVTDRRQSVHDMAMDTVCVKDEYLDTAAPAAGPMSHAVEPLSVNSPHIDSK